MNVELEEEERQATLLALAKLSLERPGWDDLLNRIARKIDNVTEGRADTYDHFRAMHTPRARPLEELCICLHDFGTHSSKGAHRCLECHCREYRRRPLHAEKPKKQVKGPDVVFIDGPDGEAIPVEPTGED